MTAIRFFVGAAFLWLAVFIGHSALTAPDLDKDARRSGITFAAIFLVGAANMLLSGGRQPPPR